MLKEAAGPGSTLLISPGPFTGRQLPRGLRAQGLSIELTCKLWEPGEAVSSACGLQSCPRQAVPPEASRTFVPGGGWWSKNLGSCTSPSTEIHGCITSVVLTGSQGKWNLKINMTQEKAQAFSTDSLLGSLAKALAELSRRVLTLDDWHQCASLLVSLKGG